MAFITSLSDRTLALLGMALCMLIYGANFVISRHGLLNGLTPHDMMALRFGVGGLLLLPVFAAAGGWRDCAGIGWRRGILLTVMSGFPMTFLMMTGLTLAPAAHGASIAPGTVTVIGVIGGVLVFGMRLTPPLAAGVLIVLAGLAMLALGGAKGDMPHVLLGDLCFLGVGILWGAYPLLVQLWRLDALKSTAVVCVLSMAYLPYYVFFQSGGMQAEWWVILLHAINQGLLNVVVGLWIWAWAARVVGTGVTGRFPPSMPVIGTMLAIPLLGEWPNLLQWLGVGLIVAGLTLAAWKRSQPASA